jgi:hypothetical protein
MLLGLPVLAQTTSNSATSLPAATSTVKRSSTVAAATPQASQSSNSTAATAERFPKQIQVEGVSLSLNGMGTRYKAIFKVYDMGLYTTKKVATLDDVVSAPGPKKLQFTALREISTTEIGQLFYRGIKENNSAELNLKHAASALKMSEIASGRAKILPGENFSIEFVPGKGLSFYVMDKQQGNSFGDGEFFAMVLGIWLGNVPADYRLKEALLGGQKP